MYSCGGISTKINAKIRVFNKFKKNCHKKEKQ